jgi:hypothetical protein
MAFPFSIQPAKFEQTVISRDNIAWAQVILHRLLGPNSIFVYLRRRTFSNALRTYGCRHDCHRPQKRESNGRDSTWDASILRSLQHSPD